MPLQRGNALNMAYETYRKREVQNLLKAIPTQDREKVLTRLQTEQFFTGGADPELYKLATNILSQEL